MDGDGSVDAMRRRVEANVGLYKIGARASAVGSITTEISRIDAYNKQLDSTRETHCLRPK